MGTFISSARNTWRLTTDYKVTSEGNSKMNPRLFLFLFAVGVNALPFAIKDITNEEKQIDAGKNDEALHEKLSQLEKDISLLKDELSDQQFSAAATKFFNKLTKDADVQTKKDEVSDQEFSAAATKFFNKLKKDADVQLKKDEVSDQEFCCKDQGVRTKKDEMSDQEFSAATT